MWLCDVYVTLLSWMHTCRQTHTRTHINTKKAGETEENPSTGHKGRHPPPQFTQTANENSILCNLIWEMSIEHQGEGGGRGCRRQTGALLWLPLQSGSSDTVRSRRLVRVCGWGGWGGGGDQGVGGCLGVGKGGLKKVRKPPSLGQSRQALSKEVVVLITFHWGTGGVGFKGYRCY